MLDIGLCIITCQVHPYWEQLSLKTNRLLETVYTDQNWNFCISILHHLTLNTKGHGVFNQDVSFKTARKWNIKYCLTTNGVKRSINVLYKGNQAYHNEAISNF